MIPTRGYVECSCGRHSNAASVATRTPKEMISRRGGQGFGLRAMGEGIGLDLRLHRRGSGQYFGWYCLLRNQHGSYSSCFNSPCNRVAQRLA